MKIIFLDMDGVLNSDRYWNEQEDKNGLSYPEGDWIEWWVKSFDPKAVSILNAIIDGSGAKIVFSSNRRNWASFGDLIDIFKQAGITGELIDITPDLRWQPRGDEIQEWLDNNKYESYIIIDDVKDFPLIEDRWIEVDGKVGLTEEHVEKALSLLSEKATRR